VGCSRRLASVAFLLLAWAAPANGDEDATRAECMRAFEGAQRARLHSDLLEARKQLRICSRDVCPDLARGDCTTWLREVEAAMPSVVVSVRTSDGYDVADARVYVDGKRVESHLTGTPIDLSPGAHHIRADAAGKGATERKIIVSESEKSRLVALTLPFAKKAPSDVRSASEPPTGAGPGAWPYVVGGIGVLALGAGVTLDLLGSHRLSNLRNDCAPRCADSDVSSTKATIIIGDSLAAGGVIALAIATYGLLSGSSERKHTVARHATR
jgi:hypothetical protein